jgi:hypothetical protein
MNKDKIIASMKEKIAKDYQSQLNSHPCEVHGEISTVYNDGKNLSFKSCCQDQKDFVSNLLEKKEKK